MEVYMEVDGLAGIEIDLPYSDVLVLQHDPLADFPKFDAFAGSCPDSGFVGHLHTSEAEVRHWFGITAIALISMR